HCPGASTRITQTCLQHAPIPVGNAVIRSGLPWFQRNRFNAAPRPGGGRLRMTNVSAPGATDDNQAIATPDGEIPNRMSARQQEMPLAMVHGQPLLQIPQDLYIPPDALEVILDAFEGPLDLLLYLIRR